MTFDRDAARQFVEEARDRDVACWFAGREPEIHAVESAVSASRKYPQTIFNIIRGAPGAGKTSLVNHMKDRAPEGRLFVELDHGDLVSRERVHARIDRVVRDDYPGWAKVVDLFLRGMGHAGRAGEVADEAAGEVGRRVSRDFDLVLSLDEGQAIQDDAHRVLLGLHTAGIGRPCVLLVAGLSHTADTIRRIKGISRLADNAVINLTRLSDAECADSTRQMLTAFGATGDIDHAGRQTAHMSFGWPKHLFRAQKALTRALTDVDGDLARVDWPRVQEESDRCRFEYYEERLSSSPLLEDVEYTAALVDSMARMKEPKTRSNLIRACQAAMEHLETPPIFPPDDPPTPIKVVDEMIDKGIWSKVDARHYEIAIPSMAAWLEDQLGDDPRPRRSSRRRGIGH